MSFDATQAESPAAVPFRFTGSGGEYFRIWIVNLLLTLLTLGIYSAWAKVRRLKYFYGNTELAGGTFDYHGSPIAILKGRLIAIGLFLLYNAATSIISVWSAIALGFLALLLPWLLRNSFRFRLRYSSYRGVRFSFRGSNGDAYAVFLGHLLIMVATAYIAAPLFHHRLKKYQHGNSYYGQTAAAFDATDGQFFRAYGPVFVLAVVVFLALIAAIAGVAVATFGGAAQGGSTKAPDPKALMLIFAVTFGIVIASSLLITPVWQARTQNLIWNHTRLGDHRFA